MRWFWIDRFVEFRAGRSATAIKSVSLAEEHLDHYFPDYPVMPHSLMIEGLAQMGGLLVSQQTDFQRRVVLAKISRVEFYGYVEAGETLTYEVQLESLQNEGALVRGLGRVGDRLQMKADLYFAYLAEGGGPPELFEPSGFIRMLRVFRLFEVGRDEQGQPLPVPPHLLSAEERDLASDAFPGP